MPEDPYEHLSPEDPVESYVLDEKVAVDCLVLTVCEGESAWIVTVMLAAAMEVFVCVVIVTCFFDHVP